MKSKQITKLKSVLGARGLTYQELADAVGVPRAYINYFATGMFLPGREIRQKICKALNMNSKELFPEILT